MAWCLELQALRAAANEHAVQNVPAIRRFCHAGLTTCRKKSAHVNLSIYREAKAAVLHEAY